MAEIAIDLADAFPKPLTDEVVRAAASSSRWAAATPVRSTQASAMRTVSLTTLRPLRHSPWWAFRDDVDERVRQLVGELLEP